MPTSAPRSLHPLKLILIAFLATFIPIVLLVWVTIIVGGIFAVNRTQTFLTAANLTWSEAHQLVWQGWNTQPKQSDGRVNFLILGTDGLATRGNAPVLTDTMLLGSLNLKTAQFSMVSLPRDTWSDTYKTKINALYTYGLDRFPEAPEKFSQEVIQEMTGVPIHYVIVLNLETLAKLIDEVGGVVVDVPVGFTDPMFPRSDVDVTKEHDPAKLYKTITFAAGPERMSGERVLEYVRSRHADGEQGSDIARAGRQQQVILSLISQFKQPNFYRDTARLGHLYQFYQANFARYFPVTDLIGLIHQLNFQLLSFQLRQSELTIFPEDPQGVLFHPPLNQYFDQWVFVIRDLDTFHQQLQTKLNLAP